MHLTFRFTGSVLLLNVSYIQTPKSCHILHPFLFSLSNFMVTAFLSLTACLHEHNSLLKLIHIPSKLIMQESSSISSPSSLFTVRLSKSPLHDSTSACTQLTTEAHTYTLQIHYASHAMSPCIIFIDRLKT